MKKHKTSIALRIFLYFIIFAGIMLGLLWACQTLFLEDFYTAVKISRTKQALADVVSSLDLSDEELQTQIVSIGKYYDASISIYDGSMTSVAQSDSIPNDSLHDLHGGELLMLYKKAEENGGTYTERWQAKGPEASFFPADMQSGDPSQTGTDAASGTQDSASGSAETGGSSGTKEGTGDQTGSADTQTGAQTGGTVDPSAGTVQPQPDDKGHRLFETDFESIIVVSIVKTAAGDTRVVFINSVLTPVSETVTTLQILLIAISLLTLIIAFLLALLFSRQLAKPIENINETAGELARGNYGVTFDEASGCREISELGATLNYATSELSQVDKLRSELIANVSHDLRTPLTMITGYSEMMRDIPGENTPENAEIIIEESKRLTTLVNDMLDLSKYKAGQPLDLETFSLTDTVHGILARLSEFTRQNGYTISFDPQEEVFVAADRNRIQQVVYNLLNNSINYTGADKTVRVTQQLEEGKVRLSFADSGVGISDDDLPHIFERYYRSSSAHKRATVGTGLGLSIVKSILDAHGAPFGVDTKPGAGSTFWFELPVCAAPQDDATAPAALAAETAPAVPAAPAAKRRSPRKRGSKS